MWGIARNVEGLESLASDLPKNSFYYLVADITNKESAQLLMSQMKEIAFVPDCFVFNAAILKEDAVELYDSAIGENVLLTNLQSPLQWISVFLPVLVENKGSFIAINSANAMRPSMRSISYAASKAGLAMAMRSFAVRYKNNSVRFANVYLGPIATHMWEGKRSFLVADVRKAAKAICKFINSGRNVMYYPLLSTTLLRMSMVLSDTFFASLSRFFLKK